MTDSAIPRSYVDRIFAPPLYKQFALRTDRAPVFQECHSTRAARVDSRTSSLKILCHPWQGLPVRLRSGQASSRDQRGAGGVSPTRQRGYAISSAYQFKGAER